MPEQKVMQVDLIIKQIQDKLRDGSLKPGEKIPSERILAEQCNTTRGYIRKALQKLEHYGVLEIIPQKGIYIPLIKPVTLDALINNILTFKEHDIANLIETRTNLEIFSAKLAAQRGDANDMERLKNLHEQFILAYKEGRSTLEEDHLFHLSIAKATKNSVLESLITLITPEIIAMNRDFKENYHVVIKNSILEHEKILEGILLKDPQKASIAMAEHMENSKERRIDPSQ
jgi:GntR family transcriptional repressor for pyruvate dehydrogenase complex